jgi:eukaryotic-like serine/threonine-protein kinase
LTFGPIAAILRTMTNEVDLQPGDLILGGRCRVESLIGRGAFSAVYLARCTDDFETDAERAVKVVAATGQAADDYRARFQRAAELAARVDHPRILHVHAWAETEGRLYLIMDSARSSLADRVRESHVPVKEAISLVSDAAAGLEALHDLGAIHRNIKPSNILIDADGRALITDLGLAQLSTSASASPVHHPGTPEYMSPEQETTVAHLSPSSDVYSLGCVLFELLTARRWCDVMARVDGASDLRPDVTPLLDAVLARMLRESPGRAKSDAKEPQKRFVAMGDVRAALANVLDGRRPAPQPRAWWEAVLLNPAAAAFVAFILLMVAAVVWGPLGPAAPTPTPTATVTMTATAAASATTPAPRH